MKVEMPIPSLTLQWRPNSEEIEKCKQFGRKFGEKIKS